MKSPVTLERDLLIQSEMLTVYAWGMGLGGAALAGVLSRTLQVCMQKVDETTDLGFCHA